MTAVGERFDIEFFIPRLPEGAENGLPQLLLAGGRLAGNRPITDIMPPSARFIRSGKLLFVIGQSEWPHHSSGNNLQSNITWITLSEELEKIRESLEDTRAALQKPAFDAALNYQAGFSLLLPHLAPLKRVASFLSADAMNELHRGDVEKAMDDMQAILALTRCQQSEPLIISQLVRIAIANMGISVTWQALQAPGWTDPQLARLKDAWGSMEFITSMARSLEMERAMAVLTFADARHSTKAANALISGGFAPPSSTVSIKSFDDFFDLISNRLPDFLRNVVYIPIWQFAWSYQDELTYLQNSQLMIEAARQAAKQKSATAPAACSRKLEAKLQTMNSLERARLVFSVSGLSGLSRCVEKAVACETLRQLALTAIALKRYELRYQTAAPALVQLVPQFLRELPADYMNGQSLCYRPNTNAPFTLYSVGYNQHDDGGDPTPSSDQGNPVPPPTLSTWFNGRDMVWPLRASAEEISEHNHGRSQRK